MLLTSNAAGAARVPLLILLVLAVLATFSGAGVWIGSQWSEGRAAIEQKSQAQKQLKDLSEAADALLNQSAAAMTDYRRATQRLNHIADLQERDREEQLKFDHQQRQALGALIASRPDLRTGHAGDDVLQHWNRANAGPTAASNAGTAAARHPVVPQTGVPGTAAGRERPVDDSAGKPRRRGKSVSPVQGEQERVDPGSERLASDGMGVVLRVDGEPAVEAGRLRQ